MLQSRGPRLVLRDSPQMEQHSCLPRSDTQSIIQPKSKFSHLQRCAAAGMAQWPAGSPGRLAKGRKRQGRGKEKEPAR